MIYVSALQHLPYDESGRDYAAELNHALEIDAWTSPVKQVGKPVVTEGPSWWHGDEDASQSFLASMGVKL